MHPRMQYMFLVPSCAQKEISLFTPKVFSKETGPVPRKHRPCYLVDLSLKGETGSHPENWGRQGGSIGAGGVADRPGFRIAAEILHPAQNCFGVFPERIAAVPDHLHAGRFIGVYRKQRLPAMPPPFSTSMKLLLAAGADVQTGSATAGKPGILLLLGTPFLGLGLRS